MKVRIFLILMALILSLHGCTGSKVMKTAAVSSLDQKIGYDETLTSQKKHFVSLSPYSILDLAKDKTIFMLSIQNCGDALINITNNSISAIFQETAGKGTSKTINIQALNDFIDDLEKEYKNKENNFINSKLLKIKIDIEYKNPPPTTEELADLFEDLKYNIEKMSLNHEMLREDLPDFFMKPQDIMPGNSCTGIVVCDTRNLNPTIEGNFKITVSIDGEEHKFNFRRAISK